MPDRLAYIEFRTLRLPKGKTPDFRERILKKLEELFTPESGKRPKVSWKKIVSEFYPFTGLEREKNTPTKLKHAIRSLNGDNEHFLDCLFWMYISYDELIEKAIEIGMLGSIEDDEESFRKRCNEAANEIFDEFWVLPIEEYYENRYKLQKNLNPEKLASDSISKTNRTFREKKADSGLDGKFSSSSNPWSDDSFETAPFKWPPHVSREAALAKDADEGVWLNPHNHFSIPLSGRETEKKLLDEFVNHDRHFLIAAIIAPSGAGKTRLVSQWMRAYMAKYQDNGWDAGFVASRDDSLWHEHNWRPTNNTLIVLDYTYNYDLVMGAIIDRFKDRASHKIRLLVLDHIMPDKLHTDIAWGQPFRDQASLDSEKRLFFDPFPIVLKPETDRSILLRDVIACSADPYSEKRRYDRDSGIVIRAAEALMTIGAIANEDPTKEQIRRRDSIRHPLFAALIGQTLFQNAEQDFSGWSRRDLITHYFERGQRIPWDDNGLNKHAKTLGPWVGCYVSAATLLRGIAVRDVQARLPRTVRNRLSEDNLLQPLVQYCNRIVSGNDSRNIKPFEPDILGEAFFLNFVKRFDGNDEVLGAFASMLSTFRSPSQEENSATTFLETLQRLVRNLINDNQEIEAVKASWEALLGFLEPVQFPKNSLMRQAVSIALGDAIKQCRTAGLDDLISQFVNQVDLKDLCNASSSALWLESATCIVHYFDWVAFEDQIDEQLKQALSHILKEFKERTKKKWPALVLAAGEGCLNTAKFIKQIFDEDINSSQDGGWTILMASAVRGHGKMVDWLISQGADPNATRVENGWTALMAASREGHEDVVERLIDANASVDQRTMYSGWSALMIACHYGHRNVVERLIDADATINQGTKDNGRTALMAASRKGHAEVVERLIDAGATVDQGTTDNGWTALTLASQNGHLDVVERLIGAGATVDQGTTDNGSTALMVASQNGHLDVVEHLIDAGATVDLGRTDDGWTALTYASRKGHAEVVERLIDAGATVDQGTTDNGWTALTLASQNGHLDVVERLIGAGATVDQGTTDDGWTALTYASTEGHCGVVERLIGAGATVGLGATDNGWTALMAASQNGHLDVVERLIDAGATVDQGTTDNGSTALMAASQEGRLDVVERLIGAGATVDQGRTDYGWTALMYASQEDRLDVVERLIGAGATVGLGATDNGWTALMAASQNGNLDVVERLIGAGAAVNQRTTDHNCTALMVAAAADHANVVECLISHGADLNLQGLDPSELVVTALTLARSWGHSDVEEILVRFGAIEF